MRIGYFGDGPWASRALAQLAAEAERFAVGFITPRYDTQDPALKEWAERLRVPFLPCADVNSAAFREQIAALGCDILVSMSFNQILKKEIIGLAPRGFINCHAGALPFYRGRNPLNWALINGEEAFGVTVHYVDEGIDTGDIIIQDMVPIAAEDTYAALLEKAHDACARTLTQALGAIADGTAGRQAQAAIHPVGFYCGRRRAGDEWIDWQAPSRAIYDFIRALAAPGPGARTLSERGEIAILGARRIDKAPVYTATPGEVVGRSADGVVVKTGDCSLLLTAAAPVGADWMPGESGVPRWPIGMRLGLSPLAELHRLRRAVAAMESEMETLRASVAALEQRKAG